MFSIALHRTTRACPAATLSLTLPWKCSIASPVRANWCGPLSTAACSSIRVHFLPVMVGHPYCSHSLRSSPAGWCAANPRGASSFPLVSPRSAVPKLLIEACPQCIVYCDFCVYASCKACRMCVFCWRSTPLFCPITCIFSSPIVGGRRPGRPVVSDMAPPWGCAVLPFPP